ncbi:MAG: hypothetical protein CBE43_11080 [Rhodopirellula sp. TMED283]|nr:MAG: hypothetical protein CBE43_11080 [Rhodopirellula sp. TMED283]
MGFVAGESADSLQITKRGAQAHPAWNYQKTVFCGSWLTCLASSLPFCRLKFLVSGTRVKSGYRPDFVKITQ